MKTFLLYYLFGFILCGAGFWFLDIAFLEMNIRESLALAFAIGCFYWYYTLLKLANTEKDK